MNRALCAIVCAAVTLFDGTAFAYMTTGNQPLDHAIYSKHEPKLIVAGYIEGVDS